MVWAIKWRRWLNYSLNEAADKIQPIEIEKEVEPLIQKLFNKIPIVYSSQNNAALAKIIKIKFNEDAKIPSFFNYFPELNHNEMTGWEKPVGPFHFLLLADDDDHIRTKKRMSITAELLKKLEKMFWSLTFGDWLAYKLAMAYGIDPTPVNLVEELKAQMKD